MTTNNVEMFETTVMTLFPFWRESHDNLSHAVNITAETQFAAVYRRVLYTKFCALKKNEIIAVQAKKAYKRVEL